MTASSPGVRETFPVHYRTVPVNQQDVFYCEAGPQSAPAILLLHGFPTSSNMFRNLIPRLAPSFHVIAPDYPGFGLSSMPDHESFAYTFENLTNIVEQFVQALGLDKYSLYLMATGAPIGYRLALRLPDRVQALIVQNGNAYEEGLREFWDPIKKYWSDPRPENREALHFLVDQKSTQWQYGERCDRPDAAGPCNVDFGPGRLGSPWKSQDTDGPVSLLWDQCAALSGVSGLLSKVSTADPHRLGQERLHLSA
jgi:pimeloyl-ACP methyl ester carboxylesterase